MFLLGTKGIVTAFVIKNVMFNQLTMSDKHTHKNALMAEFCIICFIICCLYHALRESYNLPPYYQNHRYGLWVDFCQLKGYKVYHSDLF